MAGKPGVKRTIKPEVQIERLDKQIEKLKAKIEELEGQKVQYVNEIKSRKIDVVKEMIDSGEINVEDLKKLIK